MLSNNQRFQSNVLGEKALIKESIVTSMQYMYSIPTWINSELKIGKALDQVNLFNFGQTQETNFYSYSLINGLGQSSLTRWPHFYKFVSVNIVINPDLQKVSRRSYDMLQMISEVGGLVSGLFTIIRMLFSFLSQFNTKVFAMSSLFVQSTNTYRLNRNIMKPKIDKIY